MPKIKSTDLQVNQKVDANSPDMTLVIEVEAGKRMRTGEYVFQLVVTDEDKNVSTPDLFKLRVIDTALPTAIITGPDSVAVGKGFILSGERSFDPDGGKINLYTWTLIKVPVP